MSALNCTLMNADTASGAHPIASDMAIESKRIINTTVHGRGRKTPVKTTGGQ